MLIKQGVDISFAQGVDTKTDPKRVQMGNFKSLVNMVFNKGGLLQKRNGYPQISLLPSSNFSYLTTLNGNLTALGQSILIGSSVAAYDAGNASWVTKGSIQPMSVSTLSLLKNNLNQTACDSVVAQNGLVCTTYLEFDGTSTINKYVVADATTGQNVSAPALIPVTSGTVSGGMRVFVLGNNFIIMFTNTISGTAHLQYITVSIVNPSIVGTNTDIAAAYTPAATLAWDGFVFGSNLYIAYDTTSGGQSIKVVKLTSTLALTGTPTSFTGYTATMMSVTVDETLANPIIYISFYDSGASTGYVAAVNQNLFKVLNPVQIISTGAYLNLTSAAQNGYVQIFGEVSNIYSWDSGIATNYITSVLVTPSLISAHSIFSSGASSITVGSAAGLATGMVVVDNTTASNIAANTTITVSGTTLILSNNTAGNSASSPGDILGFATVNQTVISVRSVGLASKAFIINGLIYLLTAYQSLYQSTYFLLDADQSFSSSPMVAAKIAYSNGGGYLTTGLPGVTVADTTAHIPYLIKDLIQAVNKNTNVPAGTQVAGIYAQTGVNLATFDIGTQNLDTAEIAQTLNISGGFHWMYDGYLPVENGFFLWPDMDTATPTDSAVWSTSGGSMAAQPDGSTNTNAYYYQVTYEWSDNNGNIYRSAPSIPIAVTTTGSASSGSVTLNIPTLRLTYKTANPVKIVIYRWSVAQQIYYQTTSIIAPLLNDTTIDSVQYGDTNSDAEILGNNILYTTGGVVENVNAPASNLLALFDTRLWLVDAENKNNLWFSKQIIQSTPVEMSDLFTIYVPPATGTENSTGEITGIFPMDDKLIIGKNNAFLYINGTGPDNTGANNQYSQPIFITSTVGCSNQQSFVLTPNGLMFQSNKGIWLLDRSLNTSYIGAQVEDFTLGATILSAVNVPETNQVRFTLDTGITLMYDYFYSQWGIFEGVSALSSCIFQGLHTYIDSLGRAFQELPNTYLDGSTPVLISFTTGPLRLGDLQNYQRAYFFYLLGDYFTPHKLAVSIAYDYSPNPSQTTILSPQNYSTPYGSGPSQSLYGQGNPYGGPAKLEHFRVFLERQRCMAFSIALQEIYDSTLGAPAGQGLNLSGINLVMGFKNKFPTISASKSFG